MLAKVKAVAASVWADIVDTWKRVKIFALGIAGLVIYIEWEKIKATWLLKSGQAELKSDKKEDASLAQTESSDNSQANALEQQAKELPSKEGPITDDWNTKQ